MAFPTNPLEAKLFSDSNDTTCVTSIDSTTYSFKLYCTDTTKFGYSTGSKTVNLRYITKYTTVEGRPTGTNTALDTEGTDDFVVVISNSCSTDTITSTATVAEQIAYAGATLQIDPIVFA